MKTRHFSLVELIILIVIVIVLFILLVPMLFNARTTAKTTSCTSNLSQSINALMMYGAANNNWICTYGNNFSPWYSQPGVAKSLSFKISKPARSPITQRPMTLCPDFWENSVKYNSLQGYGAAWFQLFPYDYEQEQCEYIEQLTSGKGQFIQTNNVKKPVDYILLADSAFTALFTGEGMVPGLQSALFTRRKEGQGGAFGRAIILRHKGEANIGFLGGHIGDTSDRIGMRMKSKVGAYIDATARQPIITK